VPCHFPNVNCWIDPSLTNGFCWLIMYVMWAIFKNFHYVCHSFSLGLATKAWLAKVRAKNEVRESHFMLPGVWESVKEWTSTFPSELPLWELESQWTSESFKGRLQGSKLIGLKSFFYIIDFFLEFKCLKWALMTHLAT
jgi:hypothetical protein